jgi:hypothetical protein
MKHNPYVGPRPYERQDRQNFYGRDAEARELRSPFSPSGRCLYAHRVRPRPRCSMLRSSRCWRKRDSVCCGGAGRVVLPAGTMLGRCRMSLSSACCLAAGEDADPGLLCITPATFLVERLPKNRAVVDDAVWAWRISPLVLILDQPRRSSPPPRPLAGGRGLLPPGARGAGRAAGAGGRSGDA